VPPPPEYFGVVREICDRYGVLLILDEVLCGMGRTGRWFACQHYDVVPDLVTLGKGISGGALPLAAVGVRAAHFETLMESPQGFVHGGTFTHHGVTAAAGLAAVDILQREALVERVARLGPYLEAALRQRLGDLPHVGDIRGIGFLWGVELVADKRTLAPFPRSQRVTERLWEAVFERNVIVYKSTGLAGRDGDALLLAPPFVIAREEIDFAVDRLGAALEATLA
jgi:adenosylmethionine-8-amino-7-oxononanoate aminotransferase